MVSDYPIEPDDVYFCPLRERGNRFAELAADAAQLCPAPDFEPYLLRHFVRKKSKVELRGKIFETYVWVPKDGMQPAYVAVNADRVPVDAVTTCDLDKNELAILFRSLCDVASVAEQVSPEDRVSLDTQFMRPRFARLSSAGG